MEASGIIGIVCAGLVLAGGCAFAAPQYGVYSSRAEGEAKLAEAQSSRQIATLEAKAKAESARELATAEVIRAEGVAKANKIIGESLHGNEAYLRYLWIQSLEQGKGEVIYVPTEANLPILEAQRLAPKPVAVVEPK